jgi:hypothetical protein
VQPSPESLPAIRLLMREMEVAVREEDYGAAARIRDHPWMRLAEDINMHRCARGRYSACSRGLGPGCCQGICVATRPAEVLSSWLWLADDDTRWLHHMLTVDLGVAALSAT